MSCSLQDLFVAFSSQWMTWTVIWLANHPSTAKSVHYSPLVPRCRNHIGYPIANQNLHTKIIGSVIQPSKSKLSMPKRPYTRGVRQFRVPAIFRGGTVYCITWNIPRQKVIPSLNFIASMFSKNRVTVSKAKSNPQSSKCNKCERKEM
jgi:hypothetical protein